MAIRVISNIDNGRPERMRSAIGTALAAIGVHMAGASKRLSPVDTGRLAGSITWATATRGARVSLAARAGDGVDSPVRENVVHVGTNVSYAPFVEYGTRFQRAQSFLRRAFDTEHETVKQIVAHYLNRQVVHGQH